MECLPGDLIFEILVWVPAQDIHNSTRLVCRKWYKIVNTRDFKHAHLHRSNFGLLIHGFLSNSREQQQQLLLFTTFIATGSKADDDPIEISKLSYQSHQLVLSSCNGLVLAARDKPPNFYIMNPATKQKLHLPPFFSNCVPLYSSAIAYVPTTMEYKVVRPFIRSVYKLESQGDCVAILTLGVDKDWTCRVNTQHLSLQSKNLLKTLGPLTTEGFVHWARDEFKLAWDGYGIQNRHVLTLNLETEIITQFPVPCVRRSHANVGVWTHLIYLPMGSYLSLFVLRSEFSWDFWEMKPETGEWTEMPSIDLKAEFVSSRSYILRPVGWLRPREVLVFKALKSSISYFAFAVRTRKLQEFTLDDLVIGFPVHRNSLVWINGC